VIEPADSLPAAAVDGFAELEVANASFFALCGRPHRANYADGLTMPTGWSSYAKRMGGLVPGRLQRAAVALLARSGTLNRRMASYAFLASYV
jgi:hypothetical protein